MRTRILFIDDSGKPDAAHASQAVVIGGFAMDANEYPVFARRVRGAKSRFYPTRGGPHDWEIKSTAIIKPNPWKRSKNRQFCAEILRLLSATGATTYTVTIDKQRMNHPMTLRATMPLQMQALAEHFAIECDALNAFGIIVADWSSHSADHHASRCVSSYVTSRNLPLHPGVYYASSADNEAIQVADLIGGTRRRAAEQDANLQTMDADLAAILAFSPSATTTTGRPFTNSIKLF